jgi:hypothetical protein
MANTSTVNYLSNVNAGTFSRDSAVKLADLLPVLAHKYMSRSFRPRSSI